MVQTTLTHLSKIPIPAPEFARGIVWLAYQQDVGRGEFFLGDTNPVHGSWLFFPVVLGVKTPIAFLLLAIVGAIAACRRSVRQFGSRALTSAIVPGAMLLAVLPSDVNLGVRHVLVLFPFLAVLAAQTILLLWQSSRWRRAGRAIACALVAWLAWSSACAHPDYLAYFNEIAGRHPEEIIVDSDLDWGQDLLRLSDELRTRNVQQVHLAYFGTAIPNRHDMPRIRYLLPGQKATGWIAVSLNHLKTNPGYRWLDVLDPVTTIGRSIRLYYIAPADGSSRSQGG